MAQTIRQPSALRVSKPVRQRIVDPKLLMQSPMASPSEQRWLLPTRAISIPFGFDSPLILRDAGQHLLINGHGGCAAGQIVTVDLTITQTASLALATGQIQEICTGDLQFWKADLTADSGRFVPGPAHACGLATTHLDGVETDSFDWCRDITLVMYVYLPIITHN